eukprot:5618580-Amphidinium_carterae.1
MSDALLPSKATKSAAPTVMAQVSPMSKRQYGLLRMRSLHDNAMFLPTRKSSRKCMNTTCIGNSKVGILGSCGATRNLHDASSLSTLSGYGKGSGPPCRAKGGGVLSPVLYSKPAPANVTEAAAKHDASTTDTPATIPSSASAESATSSSNFAQAGAR